MLRTMNKPKTGFKYAELNKIYKIMLESRATLEKSRQIILTRSLHQERVLENACKLYGYNFREKHVFDDDCSDRFLVEWVILPKELN